MPAPRPKLENYALKKTLRSPETNNPSYPFPTANQAKTNQRTSRNLQNRSIPQNLIFCKEVNLCIFKYTLSEFALLEAKRCIQEWTDAIVNSGSSYPLFVGSSLDTGPNHPEIQVNQAYSSNIAYVIPHFYYNTAIYSSTCQLNEKCTLTLTEEIGTIIPGLPFEQAKKNKKTIELKCRKATDGTPYSMYIFWNGNKLLEVKLENMTPKVLKSTFLLIKRGSI